MIEMAKSEKSDSCLIGGRKTSPEVVETDWPIFPKRPFAVDVKAIGNICM